MVEHDDGTAIGLQNAIHLINRSLGVGSVVQNAVRKNPIETLVRKAQLLGIFLLECAAQLHDFEMLASGCQSRFRQVNACVVRAVESEHHPLGSIASSDLQ